MWRPGPNGTMILVRGPSPTPEGYELVPGRTNIARLKLPDCKFREIRRREKPCCGQPDYYIYCLHFNKRVIHQTCGGCNEYQ